MKKLGIFLNMPPQISLISEGIGRTLGAILKEAVKNKDWETTIFLQSYNISVLDELLLDFNINRTDIKIMQHRFLPTLTEYMLYKNLRKKDNIKKKPFELFLYQLSKLGQRCKDNLNKHIASLPIYLKVAAMLLRVLLTVVVVLLNKLIAYVFTPIKKHKAMLLGLKFNFLTLRNDLKTSIKATLKHTLLLYKAVPVTELIKMVNNSGVDLLFIPHVHYAENYISLIKTKKVVAIPDFIFTDYPLRFAPYMKQGIAKEWRDAASQADHIICYSKYVKEKHIQSCLNQKDDKITIIKHGINTLAATLMGSNKPTTNSKAMHKKAIQNLQEYIRNHMHNVYLKGFSIKDMRFIFYPSQIRPHKNILSLIKAYEILLRERRINCKLILTCSLENDPIANKYVITQRLQYDVLCFPHVPIQILASLYNLAICVVNPSLFEGAFPFTFVEGYSVGTPSVMSSIPVVMHELEEQNKDLTKRMTFNPFMLHDIVNKIEWAINNRGTLIKLQKPLYDKFNNRSWTKAAKEYLALCEKCITNK